MSSHAIKNLAKEVLKVAYTIPRKRATRRTAALYSHLPIDPTQVSPKGSATVKKWVNKKISGSEQIDFLEHIRSKYLRGPLGCVAALGSHHADFERDLMKRGLAREIDCYELSAGAIEKARRLSEQQNVNSMRFYQQDLNKTRFVRDSYDAVFAVKSLHHIENLEGLFDQVKSALGPNGYFFIDDFFGPRRLQWSDKQIQIINEILAILPPELKVDLGSFRPKEFGTRQRSSVEENIAIDPSEAVRSDEILPLLKERFELLEVVDYGGNIYLNLFNKIMGNFREDHPLSQTIIRLILYIEDLCLREGIFEGSDFKYIVAKPR